MIALTYVCSAFLSFPYAGGAGYINFGDIIILFSSVILGPFWGTFIGIVGASLADLQLGYIFFIPFTIIAKGGEAFICGMLYKKFNSKINFLSFIIASLWMVLIYFFAYLINFGIAGLISSAFDLIQITVSIFGAILLVNSFKKFFKDKDFFNDRLDHK